MNNYYNKTTLDNPAELLIQVDENDKVIRPITREECHNQTDTSWHRTTHVYILNSKGELLLTKRSALKDTAPNRIVISSGGHVKFGEDPLNTAKRELREELGLESKLKFIKKYKIEYKFEREFVYVYFGKDDSSPEIDRNEVEEVIYISLEEFKRDHINGDIIFPPGSKDVCDLLLTDNLLILENFNI